MLNSSWRGLFIMTVLHCTILIFTTHYNYFLLPQFPPLRGGCTSGGQLSFFVFFLFFFVCFVFLGFAFFGAAIPIINTLSNALFKTNHYQLRSKREPLWSISRFSFLVFFPPPTPVTIICIVGLQVAPFLERNF